MNTLQHVSDIVLPFFDEICHGSVFIERLLPVIFDFSELFHAPFIAVIDIVDLPIVDEALYALVHLLFIVPKVQWDIV